MSTPHLEGSTYQNPEQVARHVWQKCTALVAMPAGVAGIRREGEAIFVTMTELPQGGTVQRAIKQAVQRAFAGANPHPAHNVIVDHVDNHIRLYLTTRSSAPSV